MAPTANSLPSASIITEPKMNSLTDSTITQTPLPIYSTLWNTLNRSLPSPLSEVTLCYLAAGGLARITSSILISPLDCIKVSVQFSQHAHGVKQYTGTIDAARSMWRSEGVSAFFRGLPPRLIYVAPAAAISFVCYEQFRVLYHAQQSATASSSPSSSTTSPLVPLAIGGMARVIGSAIRTPFDFVRQRMQVQGSLTDRAEQVNKPLEVRRKGVYRHSGEVLMRVMKMEGITTLWTGLGASVARDIPFAVTYFFTYEWSKMMQIKYFPPSSSHSPAPTRTESKLESRAGLSAPRFMMSGALAGTCAVLVTMPMDVVKVRLQTQGTLATNKYNGFFHCIRTVAREEGVRGFFKGSVPRLAYLVPASSLTFSLYEIYKRKLEKWMGLDVEV